ncbi:MAG: ABC transporter ATP-binding protein [Caldilineaceae bacterium]
MNIVELRNLSKHYGRNQILRNVSLTVEPGDFMVVYGMPTSGKSVLVRLLTGLEQADTGQILLRGNDFTTSSAGERNIGYVPQSFALYPHFSVRKNISYPLDLVGASKSDVDAAVHRASQLLGIEALLDRRPDQLSGGQKQRVAIARGLVKQTDVFVLDDPLVGLDFKLRERLIDDLKQTQETLGVTFIYTTSDAVEALMLAKHIAVLDAGEIVESGEPETLYTNPQRAQTMKFVGFPQANFLNASLTLRGNQFVVDCGVFQTTIDASVAQMQGYADLVDKVSNGQVAIGIRPEHITLGENTASDALFSSAKVLLLEDLGGEEIAYLNLNGRPLTTVLRHDREHAPISIDQQVKISVNPADLIVFVDGKRIGRGK